MQGYQRGDITSKIPVGNINRILVFFLVGEKDTFCPMIRIEDLSKNITGWNKIYLVENF